MSFYLLTVPVIVIEQTSTLQALKRSSELTHGKILQIALFLILLFGLTYLMFIVMFDRLTILNYQDLIIEPFFYEFSFKLVSIYTVFTTILFTACGVFYKTCYVFNESKKVEDLANIF
jgi:hypothetical protein